MITRIENKTLDTKYLKNTLENEFSTFKIKNLENVETLSRKVKEAVNLKAISCLLDNQLEVLNCMAQFIYEKSMIQLSK